MRAVRGLGPITAPLASYFIAKEPATHTIMAARAGTA